MIGAQAAAVKALDAQAGETSGAKRQLKLALQRARFEVAHARRQYDAVEPTNRLVASELERRWNEALQVVRRIENEIAAIEAKKPIPLGEVERQQLMQLGADLALAWSRPPSSRARRHSASDTLAGFWQQSRAHTSKKTGATRSAARPARSSMASAPGASGGATCAATSSFAFFPASPFSSKATVVAPLVPTVPGVPGVPFVPLAKGCPTGTVLGTVPRDSAIRSGASAKTPLTARPPSAAAQQPIWKSRTVLQSDGKTALRLAKPLARRRCHRRQSRLSTMPRRGSALRTASANRGRVADDRRFP